MERPFPHPHSRFRGRPQALFSLDYTIVLYWYDYMYGGAARGRELLGAGPAGAGLRFVTV